MSIPRLTQIRRRFHRRSGSFVLVLTVVAAGVFGTACRSQPGAPAVAVTADTYAVVNGRAITREQVDKAFRRAQPTSQPLSEEETLTAKLSVLDGLILEDLLLARARELKVEVPEKDVDVAVDATKRNLSEVAISEELRRRDLTSTDIREGLRRELLARKVIEHEVVSKVTVTDQEVADFFNANRGQFNLPEDAYRVAQIVVTPVRDPRPANRAGDDATTPQEAQRKVAGLMARLKEGVPFSDLARDHSEDPQTAPRGGDLGLLPVSGLKETAPPLRDAVMKAKPGSVTVVTVGGNHTLVMVLAQEKAGQRDLSTPTVRENITASLRGRREQLLRAAYLTALRTDADIVNYFARRLVESQGSPTTGTASAATAPAKAPSTP